MYFQFQSKAHFYIFRGCGLKGTGSDELGFICLLDIFLFVKQQRTNANVRKKQKEKNIKTNHTLKLTITKKIK